MEILPGSINAWAKVASPQMTLARAAGPNG